MRDPPRKILPQSIVEQTFNHKNQLTMTRSIAKFNEIISNSPVFIDKHSPAEPSIKHDFLPYQPLANCFHVSVTEFYRLNEDDDISVKTQFQEWQDLADYPNQVAHSWLGDQQIVTFAKGDSVMNEPDGEIIHIQVNHITDLTTDQLEQKIQFKTKFQTMLFHLIYQHICDMNETDFTNGFEIATEHQPSVTYYQIWFNYSIGHD